MKQVRRIYYMLRRWVLRNFVPEFVWPKEIMLDGVPFQIRNAPYSFGTKRSLIRGDYEGPERKLLVGQVLPGDKIIEMGGSIGILTTILSHHAGPRGLVVSVEASEKLTKATKRGLEQKGNIKVLTGFGFPVYTVSKNISVDSFSEYSGSLGGVVSFSKKDENASRSMQPSWPVWDIEKISRMFEFQPTMLVLDIEGSETILTEQSPAFPASVRIILIELHPWFYSDEVLKEIVRTIVNEGFILSASESTSYLFERK